MGSFWGTCSVRGLLIRPGFWPSSLSRSQMYWHSYFRDYPRRKGAMVPRPIQVPTFDTFQTCFRASNAHGRLKSRILRWYGIHATLATLDAMPFLEPAEMLCWRSLWSPCF
jgi:hypothetical protein